MTVATDPEVALQIGFAADPDDLEYIKRATHDRLIAQLGDRRTSGVEWVVYEGRTEALRAITRVHQAGLGPIGPELITRIWDHPDGVLVFAMAEWHGSGAAP